jgi:hypothetical protein
MHDEVEADEEPGLVAESDSDLAEDDPGNNYKRLLREDVYGLDIDREFKFPHGRDKDIKKPAGWHRAVRMASEIHINEMRPQTYLHPSAIPSSRPIAFICLAQACVSNLFTPLLPSAGTLLEIHYDACHTADWRAKYDETKKRLPDRKGEHKVFQSVIEGHRRKPNQRMQLPGRLTGLLRKPADELSWAILERARQAVVAEAQCERQLHLSAEELEKLAKSISANRSRQRRYNDEVGAFERLKGLEPIPKGSRVMFGTGDDDDRERTLDEVLDNLKIVGEYEPLRIRLRPLKTKREASLDDFGKHICTSTDDIEAISIAKGLSQSECLDRLLLVLWDALMLNMSEEWTRGGVANLHACEAPELARYFILGLNVGSKPLFDGTPDG